MVSKVEFDSLLGDGPVVIEKKKPSAAKVKGRGCAACTLDAAKNTTKLITIENIKDRPIMVWGLTPDITENERGKEFLGRASAWLWNELEQVGIKRNMCDTQYVVRCWPTAKVNGQRVTRKPTKGEINACSEHTDRVLLKTKASVHLVLGEQAAKILFGAKGYKKSEPIFWSDKLNARVVVVESPYELAKSTARKKDLITFRSRIFTLYELANNPGRYSILKKQRYKLLTDPIIVKRILRKMAARKRAVSVDIETGYVRKGRASNSPKAKKVITVIGLSPRPGRAYVVVVDHPQAKFKRSGDRDKVLAYLRDFLEGPTPKIFHYGCTDTDEIEALWGTTVQNYKYDTYHSAFWKWPGMRKYGLDNLVKERLPVFSGYKSIIKPYLNSDEPNYATIPLKVMRLYNGCDADIGSRLYRMTKDCPKPWLKTYISVAKTLKQMEKRGPYFDYKHYEYIAPIIGQHREKWYNRLLKICRKKRKDVDKINFNSSQQIIKLVYTDFKLPHVNEKKPNSTDDDTLKLLMNKTKSPLPKALQKFRFYERADKFKEGYKDAADFNGGDVKTKYWTTGAITSRLSSGGSLVDTASGESKDGIVNLQNVHGNPFIKNLLVFNLNWREIVNDFKKVLKGKIEFEDWLEQYGDEELGLSFDYSGIEVRILAEITNCKKLIKQFLSGEDMHSLVGHTITGWPVEQIKKDKKIRTTIKTIHFGIIYGKTVKQLYLQLISEGIDVDFETVEKLYNGYFREYPEVAQYIRRMREFAEEHGYVETMFGFKRPIYIEGDSSRGSFWANQAINTPIQGSAHHLLLSAMALLYDNMDEYAFITPFMEIHDALVFRCKLRHLKEAYREGKKLLEVDVPKYIYDIYGHKFRVPMLSEAEAGFRFASMQKEEAFNKKGEKYNPLLSVKKFMIEWIKTNDKVEADCNENWIDGLAKAA